MAQFICNGQISKHMFHELLDKIPSNGCLGYEYASGSHDVYFFFGVLNTVFIVGSCASSCCQILRYERCIFFTFGILSPTLY